MTIQPAVARQGGYPMETPGRPLHGPGITGDVRLIKDFPCDALGGERDVVVYLPPGYDAPGNTKKYPVVYLHDGQNVFNPKTAFMGREWHLDETVESLVRAGRMPPVIMVGVYNNGKHRIDEYTDVPDAKYGGGKADAYGDFLIHQMKPWVDSRFRTQADAAHTAVMGSSLGGLVSLYLSWKHPDVFGLCGALSPSLWWADQHINKAIAATDGPGPSRVWIDMGTAESPEDADGNGVNDNIDHLRELRDTLLHKGYRLDETLYCREVEGGEHNEPAWANRADETLMALFPQTTRASE